jgi:hypothetical protein
MQREFIEMDPGKLALLLEYDESRSPDLALRTPSGRWRKVPEANNIWQEYELGSGFNGEMLSPVLALLYLSVSECLFK